MKKNHLKNFLEKSFESFFLSLVSIIRTFTKKQTPIVLHILHLIPAQAT